MTTETIYVKLSGFTPSVRSDGAGCGLTSAPAALLATFDGIERSIEADCHRMDLHSPKRILRFVGCGD